MREKMMLYIKRILDYIGMPEELPEGVKIALYILFILLAAFILAEIIYRIGIFIVRRIPQMQKHTFLSKLAERSFLRKQIGIIPPLVMYAMLPIVFDTSNVFFKYIETAVWIYFIIMITRATTTIVSSAGDAVFKKSKFHDRPIKGFIQVANIVIYIVMTILIISALTHKSPLYLIGGLGAFAAVLMLIAKDSIMGFVGGFLLLENDMIRIGDWIELPGKPINGIVFDISLTIVKVRNFDNTIATVPPYTLINESFLNWRGMSESGGRRIARGYTVKLDSIKPCDNTLMEKAKKLDSHFARNIENSISNNNAPDTNAELFRMYALTYLKNHSMIRKDMLIMVRTLEPTENGLPIQFYCFTNTTTWDVYESIQAGIMEHFATAMPLFGLQPFQSTSARDTIVSGMIEANYPYEKIKAMLGETNEDDATCVQPRE